MDTQKLKIKIGEHEFEAEGPTEIIKEQFAIFKDLIASTPATKKEKPAETSQQSPVPNNSSILALDRIVRVDGRFISLTASTNSVSDAVMVIMLAQRLLRNSETVTS